MFFLQLQSQYASPPRGMAGDFQPQGMARAPHPQDTGMGPQYPQDMTGMGTQYPQAMTSAPYSQAMVRDANQQQDIPNGNELVYTDSMIISIVSCLFCWIIGLFAISKARNVSWSCLLILLFKALNMVTLKLKSVDVNLEGQQEENPHIFVL